jgi:hypothetical protein
VPSTNRSRSASAALATVGLSCLVLFLFLVRPGENPSPQTRESVIASTGWIEREAPDMGEAEREGIRLAIAAESAAIDHVQALLAATSTTVIERPFARTQERSVTDHENGEFHVNSWVDSENGSGAKVRTNFSATAILDKEEWTVKDVETWRK